MESDGAVRPGVSLAVPGDHAGQPFAERGHHIGKDRLRRDLSGAAHEAPQLVVGLHRREMLCKDRVDLPVGEGDHCPAGHVDEAPVVILFRRQQAVAHIRAGIVIPAGDDELSGRVDDAPLLLLHRCEALPEIAGLVVDRRKDRALPADVAVFAVLLHDGPAVLHIGRRLVDRSGQLAAVIAVDAELALFALHYEGPVLPYGAGLIDRGDDDCAGPVKEAVLPVLLHLDEAVAAGHGEVRRTAAVIDEGDRHRIILHGNEHAPCRVHGAPAAVLLHRRRKGHLRRSLQNGSGRAGRHRQPEQRRQNKCTNVSHGIASFAFFFIISLNIPHRAGGSGAETGPRKRGNLYF